ncbi:chymotrypsin-like protease CTRL-1 [Drosophila teissieri]|uniref:chymotrypsin-like protease CTRL-1 n=1 Tax=Drosophila teissieri TaxID=7243 RepID=UPI001CBA59C8|nr:chymotrypsin-like protease CTRL-1 [Drosophila teissieri]
MHMQFGILNQFLDGECGVQSNGQTVKRSSSPWIAFLHTTDLIFVCTGTLISHNLILTAAHCITSNTPLVARLGEFMGTVEEYPLPVLHDVRESSKHPYFDMITHANDIAVLELATKVVYTDNIRPICIVWDRSWKRHIDGIQILSGPVRGKPENDNDGGNRILDIRRQPPEMCHNYMGTFRENISSSVICAGDSNSNLCNAESSSPLGAMVLHKKLQRFVQIGIATSNQRCNMPSIYTNVLSHIEFILRAWRHYSKGNSSSEASLPTKSPTKSPKMSPTKSSTESPTKSPAK